MTGQVTTTGSTPSLDSLPDFDGTNFNMAEMAKYTAAAEAEKPKTEEPPVVAADADVEETDAAEEDVNTDAEEVEPDTQDDAEPEYDGNILKAKHGDKEYDIPEDAVVQVKINGEYKDVPLKDLQADYSGRAEISRRFTQLDKERKEFQQHRQNYDNQIAKINANFEMMKALSPEEFIHHLAVMKGENPSEMFGKMVQRTVEIIRELEQYTPEQRRIYEENRQYRIEKRLKEVGEEINAKTQKEIEEKQTIEQRRQEVFAERDAMGLKHQEFIDAISEVADLVESGELTGKWDEYDILHYAREKKILTAIQDTAKTVVGSTNADLLKRVRQAIKVEENANDGYLSETEVKQIAERLLKMHKTIASKTPTKKATPVATSQRANSKAINTKEQSPSLKSLMAALGRA